jgi:hypothetical protein
MPRLQEIRDDRPFRGFLPRKTTPRDLYQATVIAKLLYISFPIGVGAMPGRGFFANKRPASLRVRIELRHGESERALSASTGKSTAQPSAIVQSKE